MKPKTHEGEMGLAILEKTVEIICYFYEKNRNLIFYMENPRALMRHEETILSQLPDHIRHTVSYCKYGFIYMKPTDIWTNDRVWSPRPLCSKASPCDAPKLENGGHKYGVRGHKETGQLQGPQTLEERYRMPPALLKEIFGRYENIVVFGDVEGAEVSYQLRDPNASLDEIKEELMLTRVFGSNGDPSSPTLDGYHIDTEDSEEDCED